jgi:hypothetical protein
MVSARPSVPVALALAGLLAACHGDRQRSANVRATSLSPPPDAVSVSRRVEIQTVFDQDIDPASANPIACRLEQLDAWPEPVDVAYEPSSRLLTLTPQHALRPLTTYRVLLTRALRVPSGAPFASEIEWSFTTNSDAVWDRAADLALGTLLACEPSRRGGVLALWAAPDTSLQVAYGDGAVWSAPLPVGITDVLVADVADDETGRIAVAAITRNGDVLVASAPNGTTFAAPETLGTLAIHVDVDIAASGHVAVGWCDGLWLGSVRQYVPGVGWAAPFTIFGTLPHVRLEAAGNGVAVGAFNYSMGLGIADTACKRFDVDGNGNWTPVDPPFSPWVGFTLPVASKARFGSGRILVAPTTVTGYPNPSTNTQLFERTAFGWQVLGPLLGADPRACDVALGPADMGAGTFVVTAGTFVQPGLRPAVVARWETGFGIEFLGADPAPADPVTGVAIATDARVNVLWTAAVGDGAEAPVRLMSTWRLPGGAAPEPVVVDGPFPAALARIDLLRVVAYGDGGALATWSRQGVVRFSVLR